MLSPVVGEFMMRTQMAPGMADGQLGDFYEPDKFPDWPEKYKVQMKYKGFKRAILSTLRSYMNEDKLPVYKKLGQLNKPVLLVWGREDEKVPFDGNRRIREVVKCEFLAVEKAGHLPHYEKPGIVNERIIDFLDERGTEGAYHHHQSFEPGQD